MSLLKTYWKSIIVAGIVFYVSVMTLSSDKPISIPFVAAILQFVVAIPYIDKLVHIAMYFTLAAALTWDNFRFSFSLKKNLIYSILVPTVYGGVIELIQENFFPPRSGDWFDLLADLFGAIFGYLFAKMVLRRLFS